MVERDARRRDGDALVRGIGRVSARDREGVRTGWTVRWDTGVQSGGDAGGDRAGDAEDEGTVRVWDFRVGDEIARDGDGDVGVRRGDGADVTRDRKEGSSDAGGNVGGVI